MKMFKSGQNGFGGSKKVSLITKILFFSHQGKERKLSNYFVLCIFVNVRNIRSD